MLLPTVYLLKNNNEINSDKIVFESQGKMMHFIYDMFR